jgi:hypothetical protein
MATDESVDHNSYEIPANIDLLNLNNIQEIITWIKTNAKEL